MNASIRSAVVVVAALLFVLAPNIAFARAAEPLAMRWSELHPVLNGRQIAVRLTDGASVEGKYTSLQADTLSIQVKQTSDPAKHPKGATRLARPELAQIPTLAAVTEREPESLSGVAPYDLEEVVTRCLRKEPDRRFQHIDDVKIALAELKEDSDSGKLETLIPSLLEDY